MTAITGPTVRRSRFRFCNYGPDARPIIVTIKPNGSQGDMISLRLERYRQSYDIDVADLLRLLIRQKANLAHLQKARGKRKIARKFARLTS